MLKENKILIGKGENPVYLLPKMANRHGLIAGATGTGKTVTLKVLAEGLSDMGVPVFLADVKGDVSSIASAGEKSAKTLSRLETCGIEADDFAMKGYPTRFWDVFGEGGIPVRATISDVGPVLLSRLLGLTEIQAGVLNITFHIADDNGLLLIDLKDLRSMLQFVAENRAAITTTYGNVSAQSIGAIQRALLALEDAGGDKFFGEPMLDINDWFKTAPDGRGIINILHCVELAQHPLLYATFMLWMLGELYETLPEVGDLDKPKFVFFFDEAHMLFNGAPKSLVEKVTQVVKLIRSKGVGIYFITQVPSDVPDSVLSQLNNRIQHALHAYTPAEQKAVRAAAQSFRANPAFKTEDAIAALATGEALVSMLDETGAPCIVERAVICPPQSSFDAMAEEDRQMVVGADKLYAKYKDMVDNESAYEVLSAEQAAIEEAKAEAQAAKEAAAAEKAEAAAAKQAEKEKQAQYKAEGKDKYGRTKLQASMEKAAKNTAKTQARKVSKTLVNKITRGILGTNNKAVNSVAGQLAGNLVSDLVGSFFKR
ncbi:MAG: DUF853 domain-containing protein [Oscillospiraceae bacterium]|nr:DUF853 domain-containing protein [Oscillospiraceae bacterium]